MFCVYISVEVEAWLEILKVVEKKRKGLIVFVIASDFLVISLDTSLQNPAGWLDTLHVVGERGKSKRDKKMIRKRFYM